MRDIFFGTTGQCFCELYYLLNAVLTQDIRWVNQIKMVKISPRISIVNFIYVFLNQVNRISIGSLSKKNSVSALDLAQISHNQSFSRTSKEVSISKSERADEHRSSPRWQVSWYDRLRVGTTGRLCWGQLICMVSTIVGYFLPMAEDSKVVIH